MALETITSSGHCTPDAAFQNSFDPADRSLITSVIQFLQKHNLTETQAALLRELSLMEKTQVTLDELELALVKRDSKLIKESRSLHYGQYFPLPMETVESSKKTQFVRPENLVFQASDKPHISAPSEISIPSPLRNGITTPLGSGQDLSITAKFESSSSVSDCDPLPASTAASISCPSPIPAAHNYPVPIIFNNLPASNQASNVVTLLQPHQGVPAPSTQPAQILLDVRHNSIGQIQQLGTTSLNGIIPIQLNLSSTQPVQPQQPQIVCNPQPLHLINSVSKSSLQHPTQPQLSVPTKPVPIILSRNGDPPSHLTPMVSCPPKARMVDTVTNGQNGAPPLTLHFQQPTTTAAKLPVVPPVVQNRIEQEPQFINKDGAQITLDSNNRPIISYSQFSPNISHSPKAVITSNGICQVENLQLAGSTWLKESPGDVHAIPIIGSHFSLDSSFDLGQRRRKKRAVFSPHVRRALEQAFEQNTRPCRRDLEILAGQLGLLFEEVRVWFCNKRQKERQQIQLMTNDQPGCDTPSDSYNSLIDCVSPSFQSSQNMDDQPYIQEFRIKEECESPDGRLLLTPGISDSSHPLPKEILMPDPFETEYRTGPQESTITALVQNSSA